jgi:hypothetical protein
MNIYYQNEIATLPDPQTGNPPMKTGFFLNNIYDPMLELRADFVNDQVTINGTYPRVTAADSLCLGNTNALWYKLTMGGKTFSGDIQGWITIRDFEVVYANSFSLELGGFEPLYLGHLFLGSRTTLPRFAVEPESGITLASESSRSFGGQAFGLRRGTLGSFSASFPRLGLEEKETIIEYVKAVLNIEPHIIDPYPQARDEFPPMYATLSVNDVSFTKRNENGFYYSASLSWQEAR